MENAVVAERPTRSQAGLNWERWSPYIVIAWLALCYTALALKYRAYDIDNPWFQSHSYNLWNDHIDTDTFMCTSFPAGMGGTRVFGKVVSWVQATVLNFLGWSPRNGAILSGTFVLIALEFWSSVLAGMGLSRIRRSLYLLSLGMLEPFVSMACKSRWEFFSFFILCFCLWLASKRHDFPAILLSFVAVETQPIGIVVPLVTVIYLLCMGRRRARLLWYALAAGLISAAAYLWLHPLGVATIVHADWRQGKGTAGGFLTGYFLVRKRHLPELGLLIVAGLMVWKRKSLLHNHFAVSASALVITVAFLFRHNNPAYMVFLYPFLLLAVWQVLLTNRSSAVAAAVVLLLVLPQYAILAFHFNRYEGYNNQDLNAVRQEIAKAEASLHVPDDQVRIYGDYGLWFSHPHNYVAAATSTRDSLPAASVILCYSGPIQSAALTQPDLLYCPDILRMGSYQETDQISLRRHLLHVLIPAQAIGH